MTLNEIAKLAGVSRTTASYVINGKAEQYRISRETKDKVLAVVARYDYQPNRVASTLRVGNSHSFGLIIPDFENNSYARLAKLLEHQARQKGYQFIISCTDDDPETEKQVVQMLLSRKIDALVVASTLQNEPDFYQQIQMRGTPVIAIDRALDERYFTSVVSENYQGAQRLCQYLFNAKPQYTNQQENYQDKPQDKETVQIKTGPKFGFIGALAQLNVSKQREAGFLAQLKQYQMTHSTATIETKMVYATQFERQQGFEITNRWLAEGFIPDFLLTTSYTLCEGILDCILANPLQLGHIKLATFGDHSLLDFVAVPVVSLVQQYEQIASLTLNLLFKAIQGDYQAGVQSIDRLLIIR